MCQLFRLIAGALYYRPLVLKLKNRSPSLRLGRLYTARGRRSCLNALQFTTEDQHPHLQERTFTMQFIPPTWLLTAMVLYMLYKLAIVVLALAIWLCRDSSEP